MSENSFFGRFLPILSRINHSYIISMVIFGPIVLNFLNSLILWFCLSYMQYSRAWDVTAANFEYQFALVDEKFGAFFKFATTLGWDICSSITGSNIQWTQMSENIDFCQICFFHEHIALSFCPTLVKCIHGLNEAFCTKTPDKIWSKKFLNLICSKLVQPWPAENIGCAPPISESPGKMPLWRREPIWLIF